MSNQSQQPYPIHSKPTKTSKKKRRGCLSGCGRKKSFEDRIRQGRSQRYE